jgi:YD repeat-containing protein
VSRTQGALTSRTVWDRSGRIRQRDVFTGHAQRPAPRRWSCRRSYDLRDNLIREEHNDNPFSSHSWRYDGVGRLLEQDGTLPLETNPL